MAKKKLNIPPCPECGKPMMHTIFKCDNWTKHGWVCKDCQDYYINNPVKDKKTCNELAERV